MNECKNLSSNTKSLFQSKEAEDRIDKFIEKQEKENKIAAEKAKLTAGCKTVENRSVINNKETLEEKKKKESEEIKGMGNEAFKAGKFKIAEEYYTSAIMRYDQNHKLFTNRAQAKLREGFELKFQKFF